MKSHYFRIGIFVFSFWVLFRPEILNAQNATNQLWAGVLPHYTFKNRVRLLAQFDYRGVVNQNDNWARFFNLYDFRVATFTWLDIHTGSFFLYTNHDQEYENLDSWEIRPFIGARLHITQNKKINIRNFTRVEERFFFYFNTGEKRYFTRLRNRVEVLAALTKSNLNLDKMLYLNLDAEVFFNILEKPEERFINLFQSRLGPGYRFNYNWRVETFYVIQFSKNPTSNNFQTQSNIVSLRLRYYFN